jgi:NDP-mannose synthase
MQAVILAGGKGTRLKPITASIPKPLVPLDDMPILEVVLRQLRHYGFNNVVIAVNHLAELIMAFFKNGEKLNLNITYSIEDEPLGTAGPLRLIERLEDDFIMMNGDLLTTLNYADLMQYHRSNKNDITIATYRKEINIDLGVLKIDKEKFIDYIEKPTYHFDVSMGIYAINKRVLEHIPNNKKFDMPDFVLKARDQGSTISCYSGDYYWLDIGRMDDYEKALEIFNHRRAEFLF